MIVDLFRRVTVRCLPGLPESRGEDRPQGDLRASEASAYGRRALGYRERVPDEGLRSPNDVPNRAPPAKLLHEPGVNASGNSER